MGKEAWLELILLLSLDGIRRATIGRIPDTIFAIGIDLLTGSFRLIILIPVKNIRTTGNTKPTTDAKILIDIDFHNTNSCRVLIEISPVGPAGISVLILYQKD
jgi:hypothetical protein